MNTTRGKNQVGSTQYSLQLTRLVQDYEAFPSNLQLLVNLHFSKTNTRAEQGAVLLSSVAVYLPKSVCTMIVINKDDPQQIDSTSIVRSWVGLSVIYVHTGDCFDSLTENNGLKLLNSCLTVPKHTVAEDKFPALLPCQ